MDCIREIIGSNHIGVKIFILSITNILIGLWIAFVLSHFEMKQRLDIIGYQHQLVMNEMMRSGSMRNPNHPINGHALKQQLLSLPQISKIVKELEEIKSLSYHNDYLDRTGRTDFALESAGAQILSIGNTTLATVPKWFSIFGFNKITKYFINGPNRVIQPSIHPGECFAFVGNGDIIIKLIKDVFINAISIEHILPQMSPDGNILSAPSNFSVYGIKCENISCTNVADISVHLGDFRYEIEKQQPLQLFWIDSSTATETSFRIVRFIFTSNHGDPRYTCVYRIRIHGSLTKTN